jgi:transcriptional regulator with XRE-family HTH domain
MKLNSKIGENIDKSGLRDDFIAVKLGVSKRTIYNLKKGLSYPTFEKAFLLAKILGCKVDDLAFLEERDDRHNPDSLQSD